MPVPSAASAASWRPVAPDGNVTPSSQARGLHSGPGGPAASSVGSALTRAVCRRSSAWPRSRVNSTAVPSSSSDRAATNASKAALRSHGYPLVVTPKDVRGGGGGTPS